MRHRLRDSRRYGRRRRHGFTLFEVLLALGLMVVLATALIGAIDLYRRVTSTGYAEIEQAQLARAVLRQFELDLRSAVYQAAEGQGTSADQAADETADGETTEDLVVLSDDAAAASIATGAGIVGDANTLIIHTARPPRQVDFFRAPSTDISANDPLREARSVSYFLAAPGMQGLQGLAGDLFVEQNPDFETGLTRLDGDRFSVAFADASRDTVSLMASAQLLAAEVQHVQFRYFDGTVWQPAWDSEAMQRLPHAVEITVGFRPRSVSPDRPAMVTEIAASQLYRFVVAIPGVPPATSTADVLVGL